MFQNNKKWIFLFLLAFIWGSSFILIKKGLVGFTPLQLGSLRIIITALLLFLVGFKSLKNLPKNTLKWIVISGFLGTFFPAFLLITNGASINPNQNYWYAFLVIIATVMYAFSINIIKRHLQNVSPIAIAVGNFAIIIIPAFIVLIFSGFFTSQVIQGPDFTMSLFYIFLLSLFGTAIAKVLFNNLVQISTPIFASSVAYIMPIIAVSWGFLDGESFGFWQGVATVIILLGVYLANSKR